MQSKLNVITITAIFLKALLIIQYVVTGLITLVFILKMAGTPGLEGPKIGYPILGTEIENSTLEWKGRSIDVEYVTDARVLKVPISELSALEASTPLAAIIVILLVAIYINHQLLGFVRASQSTKVFTIKNIKRLQKIAFIAIAYVVFSPLFESISSYIFNPPRFHYDLDTEALLFGLILLVIVEVLKKALVIKSENELTI